MKLVLDFDGVLFNTMKMREHFTRILERKGVDPRMTELLYMKHRETGIPFSLKRFLWAVAVRTEVRSITEADVYEEILKACPSFANKELAALAGSVGRNNVFILTNGDKEYQLEKIRRTVGLDFAKEIIVVPGSKKKELEVLCDQFAREPVIFVEDQPKFLVDITPCKNLETILFGPVGIEDVREAIAKHSKKKAKPAR